ncbi:cytochrome P450 II f2-like protein II [Elysia marginata]|uniref:Cytochrome P450 II f2-like protein II n=1 Tax=Elysia marginata TaxID=1093978 RepID=A0AAV4HNK5_9GAST|nr:cytochrome P450 II f2-like protein II [Elysia marginata]
MVELSSALFACLVTLLSCCYLFFQRKRSHGKLPPCPVQPWPLIGNIFSIGEDMRGQFEEWNKQCGDLFSLYFGNTLVVVVSGYKTIKEVFVHKGALTSDRPHMFINDGIGMGDQGVVFTNGPVWKELRSTTLQILKEFGMGTNWLAEKIQEEVTSYVEKLADLKGKPVDLQHYTRVSVSNVISSIIVGKRFSHEDPRHKNTVESLMRVAESSRGAAAINFLPFLRHLPGDIFKAKKIKTNMAVVKDMLVEIVSEIENKSGNQTKESNGKNFIFSYRRKQLDKMDAGKRTFLDDENLIKTIIDLFSAGTETVSSTIVWCILVVLNSPGVQSKIHEELDREIDQERQPTVEDQASLPYLGAVIKETQRYCSVVPFSLLHKTKEEMTTGGYTIPKGTTLIPNLDSVLHDTKIWGSDADKFKPERFLDKDGSLIHREEFIPYSIGSRLCLGEAMAKMELFLFMSCMFQRFQFVCKDPENPPTLKPNIGITSVPTAFEVMCIDRFKQ